ncbi:MAG: type II secretion system F family protein, partial [Pirellulaceae bacterium]
ALNEEIRALSRAGIPFEQGLRALGEDLPGRAGRLATRLSERLERGESLLDVVEASDDAFPRAYRAVIAAGMRSGRLSGALESITRSVEQADDLRRTMTQGFVYPVLLGIIATVVFLFSVHFTLPFAGTMFDLADMAVPRSYQSLMTLSFWIAWMLPWLWLVLTAVLALTWYRARHAAFLGTDRPGWLPSLGHVRRAGRMATFAEVMALLVDHEVPLVEAVGLAAAAGGGRELREAGATLMNDLERGRPAAEAPRGFPPFLAWLLTTSRHSAQLAQALRHAAAAYRRRAVQTSVALGTFLPIFLSAILGGIVALYFVCLTLGPFYFVLYQLALP